MNGIWTNTQNVHNIPWLLLLYLHLMVYPFKKSTTFLSLNIDNFFVFVLLNHQVEMYSEHSSFYYLNIWIYNELLFCNVAFIDGIVLTNVTGSKDSNSLSYFLYNLNTMNCFIRLSIFSVMKWFIKRIFQKCGDI